CLWAQLMQDGFLLPDLATFSTIYG
ncbi:uncharacterized, partial [Tachysurus ichikawai]